jgi:hypothetical protein
MAAQSAAVAFGLCAVALPHAAAAVEKVTEVTALLMVGLNRRLPSCTGAQGSATRPAAEL